jgi:predicted MFS family arabinose efflux permease
VSADAPTVSPRIGSALIAIALLGSVIGGVGAPLITSVALDLGVPLDAAQWTLTVTLFAGAISAPVVGRLGAGPHRRPTLLITLALVALGGLLTALPLPFVALLAGRALQGLGLGAIAVMMSVARDHLPADCAQSVIATISVASTVGIGVAYPLMGLLDQLAGLRVAYATGFLLSLIAVVIAWRTLPKDAPGPPRASISSVWCCSAPARSACCSPSLSRPSGGRRGSVHLSSPSRLSPSVSGQWSNAAPAPRWSI